MCEGCFDEFDGNPDRLPISSGLIARTREIEADLPGDPVPEGAWPIFFGIEGGSLLWAHHERMARSREAAMVLCAVAERA